MTNKSSYSKEPEVAGSVYMKNLCEEYLSNLNEENFTLIQVENNKQEEKEIDLSNKNLLQISNFQAYNNLIDLNCSNNQISFLPDFCFRGLKFLRNINFSYNKVKTLKLDIFVDASSLQDVNFSNNQINDLTGIFLNSDVKNIDFSNNFIKNLDANLISSLENLENLDLSSNKISRLDENIFFKNVSLKKVNFSNNEIEELPSRIFNSLNNLNEIRFDANKIANLDENLFSMNNNLDTINFSINKLSFLPEKLLSGLTLLKRIFLFRNKLTELSAQHFIGLKSLEFASFGENQLKDLDENVLIYLENLDNLHLNGNKISKIPKNIFQANKKIEIIEFSNNQIREIPDGLFDNLCELTQVYFNSNNISQLSSDVFKNNLNLQYIDFGNNLVKELQDELFEKLTKLKKIFFNNNKLSSLREDLFKNNKKLIEINFSHNQFVTIPQKILDELKSLKKINFSKNKLANLSNLFSTNISLNSIDLSENQITKLDDIDIFSSLTKLVEINFNSNQITSLPKSIFKKTTNLERIQFAKNKLNEIPDGFFENLTKIKSIDFYNNKIETLNLAAFENFNLNSKLNFNENIDLNDISYLVSFVFENLPYEHLTTSERNKVKQLFKSETISESKFLSGLSNKYVLYDRLLVLFMNKKVSMLENLSKSFSLSLEKIQTDTYSILDFILSILDSSTAIFLKEHLDNMLKQNEFIKNLEFRFLSSDSLVNIIKQNSLLLFESFFKNEIELNINEKNSYIFDESSFYFSINFIECMEIILENSNEKLAICLFRLLKYIYLNYEVSNQENILEFNQKFLSFYMSKIFEKNWTNLIKELLDFSLDENFISLEIDNQKNGNFLELINDLNNPALLKHSTTRFHLAKKWNKFPRSFYYSNLIVYVIFLILYSIQIDQHTKDHIDSSLVLKMKIISIIFLIYFLILRINLFYDWLKNGKGIDYLNIFELANFPLCLAALLISDNNIKSALFSFTILMSYSILIARLDKIEFQKIGPYTKVFGKIIKDSLFLFLIVCVCLMGFVLAFRNIFNNSKNDFKESKFNTTYEKSFFIVVEMLIGNIDSDLMGVDRLNNAINFFLYGLFIFLMPILFINIFTGISIDEIQKVIENAEVEIIKSKIYFVYNMEPLKRIFSFRRNNTVYSLFNSKLFNFIFNRIRKSKINKGKNSFKKDNNNEELIRVDKNLQDLSTMVQYKFDGIDRNLKVLKSYKMENK